jgi:hypothetical protein
MGDDMGVFKLAFAAAWCLGGAFAGLAWPAHAETPLPPAVIHFCSANCFTLSPVGGQYVREDGTPET